MSEAPEPAVDEHHIRLCCLEFAQNMNAANSHEMIHIANQLAEFVLHGLIPADIDDAENVVPIKPKPKKKA